MSRPTEKEQLYRIRDSLLGLITECNHVNFKDYKYPYKKIGDLSDFCWKKYWWIKILLEEKYINE